MKPGDHHSCCYERNTIWVRCILAYSMPELDEVSVMIGNAVCTMEIVLPLGGHSLV